MPLGVVLPKQVEWAIARGYAQRLGCTPDKADDMLLDFVLDEVMKTAEDADDPGEEAVRVLNELIANITAMRDAVIETVKAERALCKKS